MKGVMYSLMTVIGLSLTSLTALAQTSTTVDLKGKQIFLDRTPVEETFNGTTTITVDTSGTEITVTLAGYAGEWSSVAMTGQYGNKRFIAANLSDPDRKGYVIQGTITKKKIQGHFLYFRHGDPNGGLVTGWTRVDFKGTW